MMSLPKLLLLMLLQKRHEMLLRYFTTLFYSNVQFNFILFFPFLAGFCKSVKLLKNRYYFSFVLYDVDNVDLISLISF